MLRFSTSKIVATIGFIVIGLLLAVPSLFTPQQRQGFVQSIPSWVPGWMVPTRAIVLGLDLQGGSHVLLEVDVADLVRGRTGLVNQLRDDVRRVLRDNRASVEGGIQVTQRGVQLRISDPNERARIAPKLRELSQPITNPILGQTGANTLTITESPEGLIQLTFSEQGITERIRRAVDQAIEVLRRRVDALGTTEPNIQRQGADRILVQVPGLQDPQRLKEILGQTAKLEFRMMAEPGATDVDLLPSKETPGQTQAIERRVIVEGGDLTDAQPGFDNRTGEPVVNFKFNIRGAQRFGQTTSENVGRLLAIVLDMFATYGLFGFFANIALLVHVGLIFGLMSVLQATLTLPGIAGIVLTIGTAVDSNVLIYERIREEVHAGRSIVSAIQAGFDRAFATIIDSNSTMAIAAVILYFLGSGPVRGFAVVFLLGILTTVITAVTLTRMMIALWYHYARPKALPF